MKEVKDILFGVSIEQTYGSINKQISSIAFDSRKVELNTLFIAIKGDKYDGHEYIDEIIENGCFIFVVEEEPNQRPTGVTFIRVNDTRIALSIIASNYYDNPSRKLDLIGITGTNGKTTIASLCCELFTQMGYAAGLLSTVEIKYGKQVIPSTHTTPDPIAINSHLDAMVKLDLDFCFCLLYTSDAADE